MDLSKEDKINHLMGMYLDRQTMREEETLLLLQELSESAELRAQLNFAAAGLEQMKRKRRREHPICERDSHLISVNKMK
ncbi:MAG: hypothetical protein IJV06_08885 [Bacteroidaceae bacterium]|nr:hypothetical protein [Bacteroidaceae bacterium]